MIGTKESESSRGHTNLALAVLSLGTFVLGSAETVVVGVLNLIAADLEVSVATAGVLVTAYALGLSLGGPLLTAATIRFGRRPLLWASLAAWLAGNVIVVAAADFGLLIFARVLTGSLQGLFIGAALAVATSIVPAERAGRATAAVVGGFAVSTALGVPAGTFVGQELGWQGAFVAIILLGLVVLIAALVLIPPVPNTEASGGTAIRYALAPRVLAMLGLAAVLFTGQFAAFTYIAPFLEGVTGVSGGQTGVFLLAYGAAAALGAFGGGWFADRNATRALTWASAALTGALGVLYLVGSAPILVALVMVLWGLVAFGLIPSLQYRVVSLAGPGGALAATFPASALNAGVATGSLLGGWAIANHGPSAPFVVAILVFAIALPMAWATGFLKPPVEG